MRLRSIARAETVVRLGPLGLRDVERYFEESARRLGLAWSRADLHGLAVAAHGFPSGMRDLVADLRDPGRVDRLGRIVRPLTP
jgi:hypothetical protein